MDWSEGSSYGPNNLPSVGFLSTLPFVFHSLFIQFDHTTHIHTHPNTCSLENRSYNISIFSVSFQQVTKFEDGISMADMFVRRIPAKKAARFPNIISLNLHDFTPCNMFSFECFPVF